MPVGRPAKVEHVRQEFFAELYRAETLVEAMTNLPTKIRKSKNPGIHPKHRGQVIELAFMGIVASWEEFLEQALVRYLTGAQTKKGNPAKSKAGRADTIQHAYELLSLDPAYNPYKSYLKVSDPRWMLRICDFYFSTHPFNCLRNKIELIRHANAIRNRVAHSSTKSKADFKSTALYFIRFPGNSLSKGYGPGALLQAAVQRHFGPDAIAEEQTHFAAYVDLFEDLATEIVPV